MRKLLFPILALILALGLAVSTATPAQAADITVNVSQNWSDINTGSGPGGAPDASDTVIVTNAAILTVNVDNATVGTLDLGSTTDTTNGTLAFNTGSQLVVGGTLKVGHVDPDPINQGGINMTAGGTLVIVDAIAVNNLLVWNPGTGTVVYGKSGGPQTITNALGAYNNLTASGTNSTKTLAGETTVNGDLTIVDGTTNLDVSSDNYTLNVGGNWSNGGTFNAQGGTVLFNGSGPQNIGGNATDFNDLTIANAAFPVTASTNFNVALSGTLTVADGAAFSPNADVVINNSGQAGSITGLGIIYVTRIAGTADYLNQYKFTNNTLGGMTVVYAGVGAQTVNSTVGNYGALFISGTDNKTLDGAVTVNGSLVIGGGATLDVSGSNYALNVGGNWSNGGIFAPQGGTVTLNGVGAPQTIGGANATSFNSLTISNTDGTIFANTPFNVAGTLTLTAGSVRLYPAAGVVINDGGAAGTITGSGTIYVTRTDVGTADYLNQYYFMTNDLGSLNVNYNGNGAQTVNSTLALGSPYGGLSIDKTGPGPYTRTLGGAVTVNGLLFIESGTTLDVSSDNYALNVGGNWWNNQTFNGRGGTVTFTGGGVIDGNAATTFNNLTISGGTRTLNRDITTNGNLTIGGGTTLNANGYNIYVGGNWTKSGSFTNQDTVTMNGTVDQNISGATPFYNLVINSGHTTTLLATITIGGDLTVGTGSTLNLIDHTADRTSGGGALNLAPGATLWIEGTNGFPTGYTIHNLDATSNVMYGGVGTAQTVSGENYGHLSVGGGGTKTLGGHTYVRGNLVIYAGTTLDADATNNFSLTVSGIWLNNNGNFNARNGRVTLNGAGAPQPINGAPTTFYDLQLGNAGGYILNAPNVTINHNLQWTATGLITTGANKVIIGAGGSLVDAGDASYIFGNLQKHVASNAMHPTFEIGTDTGYEPIEVGFGGVTVAGELTCNVTASEHPQIGSSNIVPGKDVNLYWTFTNSGITFMGGYAAWFHFTDGYKDPFVDTTKFIVERWDGASWSPTHLLNPQPNLIVVDEITSFSDFAVGEAINHPPVAVDDNVTTPEETAVVIAVLANDSDPDVGDTLTVSATTQGAHGTVTDNGTHATYTPALNYFGSDNFTYTADDGHGGTDNATVYMTITGANDPPVAVSDNYTTNEDILLDVAAPGVLANDIDVDGDTLTVTSQDAAPKGIGTVSENGSLTYDPAGHFEDLGVGESEEVSFRYFMWDSVYTDNATIYVIVTGVNDAPVAVDDNVTTPEETAVVIAVLANDSDPDVGDTLTVSATTQGAHGTVTDNGTHATYTPALNYFGSDNFTYTADDGHGGTDNATVYMTITGANDPPVADNLTVDTGEDTPVDITLTASDVEGAPLTYSIATPPANGTLSGTPPDVTYSPSLNYVGADTFTFNVYDGALYSDNALVSINVYPVHNIGSTLNPRDDWYWAIQDAINVANPFDTIVVGTGTYPPITIDRPLTLQAGSLPVINGFGANTAVTINADNVTLTGFTIQNGNPFGIYVDPGCIGDVVHFCNIINNAPLGLFNDSGIPGPMNAENNWWGTKEGAVIATMVAGDPVDYEPWIGAAVVNSTSQHIVGSDNVDAMDEAGTEVIVNGIGSVDVTVSQYEDDPGEGFSGGIGFIDVMIQNPDNVDSIEIRMYYTDADIVGLDESSLRLQWWDDNVSAWVGITPPEASGVETRNIPPWFPPYSGYMWAVIRVTTTPGLADLTGTPFGGGGSAAGGVGGGGGGGGGGGLTLPTLKGLVSTPMVKLDTEGKITARCVVQTTDGKLTLDIAKNTRLLDSLRRALTSLSAEPELSPPAPPSGAAIVLAYNFGPEGAVFLPAIRMSMEYDPATFSGDVNEESLYIAYWDGSKWVALKTTVNTMTRTASCDVNHLSTFALIGAVTPPAPAAFSVSALSIYPLKVKPEEAVTITVAVANSGGTEGSYNVALKIDGAIEAEESVTVAPGSSQSVSFSVAREEAGSYSVDVNGLSGSFTVAAAEEAPPTPAPIAWWIWVIVGVVVVGLIIFFVVRRMAH